MLQTCSGRSLWSPVYDMLWLSIKVCTIQTEEVDMLQKNAACSDYYDEPPFKDLGMPLCTLANSDRTKTTMAAARTTARRIKQQQQQQTHHPQPCVSPFGCSNVESQRATNISHAMSPLMRLMCESYNELAERFGGPSITSEGSLLRVLASRELVSCTWLGMMRYSRYFTVK